MNSQEKADVKCDLKEKWLCEKFFLWNFNWIQILWKELTKISLLQKFLWWKILNYFWKFYKNHTFLTFSEYPIQASHLIQSYSFKKPRFSCLSQNFEKISKDKIQFFQSLFKKSNSTLSLQIWNFRILYRTFLHRLYHFNKRRPFQF